MGFLKFLLAIGLVILGFLLMAGAFLSCVGSGITSSMFGTPTSETSFWLMGIIGFVIFLGGVYMLKKQ